MSAYQGTPYAVPSLTLLSQVAGKKSDFLNVLVSTGSRASRAMNSPIIVEPIWAMSGVFLAAIADTSFWCTTSQPTGVTLTVMFGCCSVNSSVTALRRVPSSPMAHTVSVCFLSAATCSPPPLPQEVRASAVTTTVAATLTDLVRVMGPSNTFMYALYVSAYMTL